MSFQRIACATDFSKDARVAFRTGLDLAAQVHGRVILIHVYEPPVDRVSDAKHSHSTEEAARRNLQEWRDDARKTHPTVPVEIVAVPGVDWDRIIGQAGEHDADLLIVGTRGRTGIERVLIGSVAERVVRHAPCPVLVTRETT